LFHLLHSAIKHVYSDDFFSEFANFFVTWELMIP